MATHKVGGPCYVVTLLHQTPIFEWCEYGKARNKNWTPNDKSLMKLDSVFGTF